MLLQPQKYVHNFVSSLRSSSDELHKKQLISKPKNPRVTRFYPWRPRELPVFTVDGTSFIIYNATWQIIIEYVRSFKP